MARFFIDRPIVAMVIAILTVIVGAVTMLRLPTAQFPEIVPPEVVVRATFPGADSRTLEQSVATPIEQQLIGVDNMNYMYSINSNAGSSSITVNFDVKTDPNIDQVLTQLRTSQAQSQLPPEVTAAGLTVQKSLSAPLMMLALYSPRGTYDSSFMSNYAYINLSDELARLPGIARVQVFGAGQYAMRVWAKPDKLAKLGVTVPQIIAAIQSAEHGESRRTGRRRTDSTRPGIHLHGAHEGTVDESGRVRRHCAARPAGRLDAAAQRRCPGGTGRAVLRDHQPL